MDLHEFMQRADDLINLLGPRIDGKQAGFIRENARAGDWDEAIDNLIATLRNRNVPINLAEKAQLRGLVEFMNWPDSALHGLTVTTPPEVPPAGAL
jgi:hypothetical protein